MGTSETVKGSSKFGPGGLRVVFKDDPATPCMVYFKDGSATFHCALEEGDVDGHELSEIQIKYLLSLEHEADAFYNAHRIIDGA